jgi:hypothetical protein
MEDPFISFMIWKGAILIGIAGVIAFWEGYTGKKLFRRGDQPERRPEHMGEMNQTAEERRLPVDRQRP